jgi:hypothetical protein
MELVSSKLRVNLDVDYEFVLEDVKRVKLSVDNPSKPGLWLMYFYGLDEKQTERIIRVWFYDSERKRSIELQTLQERYPQIKIE